MLNRQPLGFRIHLRKLNRQLLGFRKLNRRPPVLKADEHLVTCNQCDMHQGEKFERHPPGLSLHVKLSKLNRSLRLGFRQPELQMIIDSDNIKECRSAIRYHRSLAKTSRCSHPHQLLKQSKESSIRSYMPTSVMKKKREQLSSTENSAGAHQSYRHHQCPHHQVRLPSNSYTLPGDNQEDVHDSETTADDDNNDRKQARRVPVVKINDQRESLSDAHAPLIVGKYADASGLSRTMTPIMQPETDEKGYCYSNSRRLSAQQSYVVVPSTWLDETDRQECVCSNPDESAN